MIVVVNMMKYFSNMYSHNDIDSLYSPPGGQGKRTTWGSGTSGAAVALSRITSGGSVNVYLSSHDR